jgi:hypothetical protein
MRLLNWARRSSQEIWSRWPSQAYDKPRYQHRLAGVVRHVSLAVAACPTRAIQVTSLCAGDGRDVIGALATHPRCSDVRATLVELNPTSVANGRTRIAATGLGHIVKFIEGDATSYETYRNIPRADVLLVCGVWGHVPEHQRSEMMRAICGLTQIGGTVIWTRGVGKGMERLDEIKALFTPPDWKQIRLDITPDREFVVASYRLVGPTVTLPAEGRIFDFC